jgi:hypothetical protein
MESMLIIALFDNGVATELLLENALNYNSFYNEDGDDINPQRVAEYLNGYYGGLPKSFFLVTCDPSPLSSRRFERGKHYSQQCLTEDGVIDAIKQFVDDCDDPNRLTEIFALVTGAQNVRHWTDKTNTRFYGFELG